MTFRQCAEDYLAVNASKWRNAKHRKEWLATLTRYAYPVFGNLSVAAIDSGLVFKALAPLVADKPVTASRVRGRIETVLDFARAAGRRDGDNPPQGGYQPSAATALREGWRKASAGASLREGTGAHGGTAQNARAAGAAAGDDHSHRNAPRCRATSALCRVRSGCAGAAVGDPAIPHEEPGA